MITYQEVTIDFADQDLDDRIREWMKEHLLKAEDLSDLSFTAKVQFDVDDLDEVEIVAAYDELHKLDDSDLYHVGIAYRRLAEGDIADAMDILSRQFHLAPPHHEKRVADLLSSPRA